ncbi:uncharacterized protein LOC134831610 [Culicoides brevitarsis]|uniref:uncharacterized protein LOC134831610 n=1 Tax=Culicoides brevitarsis TaxID=469753 RepID=UPI00307B853C
MLSGSQLIKEADKLGQKLIVTGLKSVNIDNSEETLQEFARIKRNYKEVSCKERIARHDSRMQGNFNPERRSVTVKALTGTSHRYFGQQDKQGTHLRLYEALYLMEINDLVVYYNDVIISIEQAYALFLGTDDAEMTFEQYMAYKNLLQSGFVALKHRKIQEIDTKIDNSQEVEEQKERKTENNDIWDCLRSKIHFLNWKEINSERLDEQISGKFDQTCAYFNGNRPNSSTGSCNFEAPVAKKPKLDIQTEEKIINDAKTILPSNETHEYSSIFSQLDIIEVLEDPNSSKIDFDFDIFLAEEAKKHKISESKPNFYGKVVNFDTKIDYSVIHQLKSQANGTPVMILIVFDNLSISSFIC